MWLKRFKIALIERDSALISKLLDEMPKFDTISQMREAQLLMAQAHEFITLLKEETVESMAKIQQNKDYLRASVVSKSTTFNIRT
jgi:hypothetical protein